MKNMSLVIALFDTGSDDGEPYCYACGIPDKQIEECDGSNEQVLPMINALMHIEALEIGDEDMMDIADTGDLITIRIFSSEDLKEILGG